MRKFSLFFYFEFSTKPFIDVFKRILLEKYRLALKALHTIDQPIAPIWMHHHERLFARQATTNFEIFGQSISSNTFQNLLDCFEC